MRSKDIRIECSAVLHLAVYIYGSNHEQRMINVSYRMDSAIAPDRHSAAAECVDSDTSSVLLAFDSNILENHRRRRKQS